MISNHLNLVVQQRYRLKWPKGAESISDQQTLELAAKAAGVVPVLCFESARNCLRIGNREKATDCGARWMTTAILCGWQSSLG